MKKVIIWGTKAKAQRILHYLDFGRVNVIAFTDNECTRDGIVSNVPYVTKEKAMILDFDYIIIASSYYCEITVQLQDMGIPCEKIVQAYNAHHMIPNTLFFFNDIDICEEKLDLFLSIDCMVCTVVWDIEEQFMKILIWSMAGTSQHEVGFWKRISKINGWDCIHIGEFFNISYDSQESYENIMYAYHPDVIALVDESRKKLPIHIDNEIPVISYWDHYYQQFTLLGKEYFNLLEKNDYVITPALDLEVLDLDNVLQDDALRKRIFSIPFLPTIDVELSEGEMEKCGNLKEKSEVVVVSHRKQIDYYFWLLVGSSQGVYRNDVFRVLGDIVPKIRRMILDSNGLIDEVSCIDVILKNAFDKYNFWKYCRLKDDLLNRWKNDAVYCVFVHEYMNCIVDWLCEGTFDLKIWGRGWDKSLKYRKYAMGAIKEGDSSLRYIYRNAKISVSPNIQFALHRRNFEAMREGCMVVQPECKYPMQVSSYKHFFVDGISIVESMGKEDLLNKIDYYLSHDDERKGIATNAITSLKDNKLNNKEVLWELGRKLEHELMGK